MNGSLHVKINDLCDRAPFILCHLVVCLFFVKFSTFEMFVTFVTEQKNWRCRQNDGNFCYICSRLCGVLILAIKGNRVAKSNDECILKDQNSIELGAHQIAPDSAEREFRVCSQVFNWCQCGNGRVYSDRYSCDQPLRTYRSVINRFLTR